MRPRTLARMRRDPLGREESEPFARDPDECVLGALYVRDLFGAALLAGIEAGGRLFSDERSIFL